MYAGIVDVITWHVCKWCCDYICWSQDTGTTHDIEKSTIHSDITLQTKAPDQLNHNMSPCRSRTSGCCMYTKG